MLNYVRKNMCFHTYFSYDISKWSEYFHTAFLDKFTTHGLWLDIFDEYFVKSEVLGEVLVALVGYQMILFQRIRTLVANRIISDSMMKNFVRNSVLDRCWFFQLFSHKISAHFK